jgi:hypothetical protein
LIKSVERLEASGAATAKAPARVGMCWTRHDERVDAAELARGEWIAADVYISPGDMWSICERVTEDEQDLGVVYEANGPRLGIVVALDGSLIRWRPDPGPEPAAAPPAVTPRQKPAGRTPRAR